MRSFYSCLHWHKRKRAKGSLLHYLDDAGRGTISMCNSAAAGSNHMRLSCPGDGTLSFLLFLVNHSTCLTNSSGFHPAEQWLIYLMQHVQGPSTVLVPFRRQFSLKNKRSSRVRYRDRGRYWISIPFDLLASLRIARAEAARARILQPFEIFTLRSNF